MTRNKITQKEAIYYQLYKALKEKRGEYVPVFEFMGEIYCKEVSRWGFVSHECSARASEMRSENPDLIQHKVINGKTPGVKYFGYRINPEPSIDMFKDEKLLKFHKIIRAQSI